MTDFKIGDRVMGKHGVGTILEFSSEWSSSQQYFVDHDRESNKLHRGNGLSSRRLPRNTGWFYQENEMTFIEGGASLARKTYKLKKDTPTVRKGAIFQEACDDGTQEYIVLSPELIRDSRGKATIFDRVLVEEQPTWFEEVFKVEPQYMTRDELDQWEAFKAGPAVRGGDARVSGSTTARKKRTWTQEQRAAHGAKIKAAHRRKKAAAKRAA